MDIRTRITELRQRATHLYQCAQCADSRAAYNQDMQAAARCEDEADELAATLHDQEEQP